MVGCWAPLRTVAGQQQHRRQLTSARCSSCQLSSRSGAAIMCAPRAAVLLDARGRGILNWHCAIITSEKLKMTGGRSWLLGALGLCVFLLPEASL